jgi:hypothetical protein
VSAKRRKPLADPRPAVDVRPGTVVTADDGRLSRRAAWLGLAWLIGFCLFFYSFELPNNAPLTRMDVWLSVLDASLLEAPFRAPWGNLSQRAGIAGIAACIVAGAWGLGSLILRLVAPSMQRTRIENAFFATGLGLSAVSLATLGCGLAGALNRTLLGGLLAAGFAGECALAARKWFALRPGDARSADGQPAARPLAIDWLVVAAVVPFLVVMWLGAMSPDSDFDVRAYHFQGPKEYFLAGRIGFLPHNVYTNFPFLTEMITLLAMVLSGDWWTGALAGKCALFAFAPLTALGLYAAGRRWFTRGAGLAAALVFLSTPWIYRISIIAYAEGALSYYLFASLVAAGFALERMRAGQIGGREVLLTGLFAGSGMACKYTGLMQVVAPAGLIVLAGVFSPALKLVRTRAVLVMIGAFSLGVALTIGPWLLKNLAETGNPVYPLAWRIFGGTDMDAELDAQFRAAHTSNASRNFGQNLVDVLADNDWSSPLLFGLAPLALFGLKGRRIAGGLWLVTAYLFLTWWAFTHRIDRFWVPLIPVASLLAGAGAVWRGDAAWRWGSAVVIALAAWFNLGFVAGETTGLSGPNAFLGNMNQARSAIAHPYIAFLNTLPAGSKVLCVGEGEVFEARMPVVYNTVFDRSIFEDWLAAPGGSGKNRKLKPVDEIRAKLRAEGITHIYVNWDWIRRYRSPGNYGYTEFVSPSRFDELMRSGVLGTPVTFGRLSVHKMSDSQWAAYQQALAASQRRTTRDGRPVIITGPYDQLPAGERATIEKIGSSLLTDVDGHEVLIDAQVFPVR